MSHLATRTRRFGLALALALSLLLAGGGVWVWIGPETVGAVSTGSVLALLGLLALPIGTGVALVYESRVRWAESPRATHSPKASTLAPRVEPARAPGAGGAEPIVARDIALPGGAAPKPKRRAEAVTR